MSESITDIVNEALAADQCHGCVHYGTCKHYENLKDAIEGHKLQLASDARIIAMVATDDISPDNPAIQNIILKHPTIVPVVAIIQCLERRVE